MSLHIDQYPARPIAIIIFIVSSGLSFILWPLGHDWGGDAQVMGDLHFLFLLGIWGGALLLFFARKDKLNRRQ